MTSPLDSYKASLDKLAFDEEAKARIASKLKEAAAQAEKPTCVVEFPKDGGRRRPRRRIALVAACLAAALALGGGGGIAVAAGVLPNPADVLSDVFGGAPAQTELLGDIGRPVGASATSNGVTVTADAVIGDRSNYAVVYTIEFDDPSVLEGIEPGENGTLPLVADASSHVDGAMSGGGAAWFYDADPDDGAIQYAEAMGFDTWNGEGIVGHTMRFSLSGIKAMEDTGETRTIAVGTWNLKFAMNYADTTIDLPSGQKTAWRGSEVSVDAVAVSSVGIRVDYTIDRQVGDLGPSGKMSDEAQDEMDAVVGLPVTVAFADGTTFDADSANSSVTKQGDGTSSVVKTATFNRIVSVEDVVSVTVGDVEIPADLA